MNKQQQEQAMSKLLKEVKELVERANMKDYEPTMKERFEFSEILTIINNMSKWF